MSEPREKSKSARPDQARAADAARDEFAALRRIARQLRDQEKPGWQVPENPRPPKGVRE